jgi:hypothetical protein
MPVTLAVVFGVLQGFVAFVGVRVFLIMLMMLVDGRWFLSWLRGSEFVTKVALALAPDGVN